MLFINGVFDCLNNYIGHLNSLAKQRNQKVDADLPRQGGRNISYNFREAKDKSWVRNIRSSTPFEGSSRLDGRSQPDVWDW
jgi:hypothetical protein